MLIWLAVQCGVSVGMVCLLTAKVIRRPIEMPGLVVCLIGCLAAGLGSYAAAILWVGGHTIPWLEIGSSLLFWPCASLAPAFVLAYILRRWASPGPIMVGLLFPCVVGCVTGYVYALTDGDYEGRMFYTNWYAVFLLPAAPGDCIANVLAHDGADWQGGELEFFAGEIAFWSGLVWLIVTMASALPIHLVTQRHVGSATRRPDHHTAIAA